MIFVKTVDIKGKKTVLSKDVHGIEPFENLMREDPSGKWMLYLHYKHYPVPNENPFFNLQEGLKADKIKKHLGLFKKTPPESLQEAEALMTEMYTTPAVRMYHTLKKAVEKASAYIDNMKVDDKTFKNLITAIKEFKEINKVYTETVDIVVRETKTVGNSKIPYDLR